MTRYLKTPVTQLSANESAALQQINKNLDDIQSAIQDTVSRSGMSPTQMTADLDLNGKRIINAPAPLTDNDFVRRVDVVGDITTVQQLVNAASTAAGQAIAAAEGVQEAIADAHVGIVADDLMLGDDSKIRIAANNIDDISACVDDIEDIKAVGDNISNVNAVADNETNINAVNNNKTNIDAVAGNKTNIDKVADISTDVSTVANNVSDVGAVVTNMSDVKDCADNMTSITGASTQAANAAASAQSAAVSAQQAAISAAGTHFKLFHHDWFDYELNDMAWLRADTFSWQNGTIYTDAYNHLVDDVDGKTASNSDTIGSYTVYYVLADDGHKIVGPDQEATVNNIYNESGVAWYYVLDKTNQRFKLPRELPITGKSKGNGMALGLKSGDYTAGLTTLAANNAQLNWTASAYGTDTKSAIYGTGPTVGSVGITSDQTKSGIISHRANENGQQYLYFYVGQFSQSATEQTAGLNSELFNGKMDRDMSNMNPGATAKETIVGWGMPSNRYIDLTLGASYSTYTAPDDGYFYLSKQNGSVDDGFCGLYTDKLCFVVPPHRNSDTANWAGFVPVKKGDILTVEYTTNGAINAFRFIYLEGNK